MTGLTLAYSAGTRRAGEQVTLKPTKGALLGREEELFPSGPLDDPRMSRQHAVFQHQARRWMVKDAGSKNGTFVNGRRVEEHALDYGDVVLTGNSIVVFCEIADPGSVAAGALVGVSQPMVQARTALEQVARTGHTVLIVGDTGTGKEVAARELHKRSLRTGPMVAVNCASLRGELLESELFGHVRGAFTGADRAQEGLFRRADGGTLFLDEIGELPAEVQARLLRALQEHVVRPVGGTREVPVDTRVVAATNRGLESSVRDGAFRADLYARLARWIVQMPALRARPEDLGVLVRALLDRQAPDRDVDVDLMDAIMNHRWPLNVRGLDNVLTTALISQPGQSPLTLQPQVQQVLDRGRSLEDPAEAPASRTPASVEELQALLTTHKGRVSAVARDLGASRQQIYRLLEKHALKPEDYR